MFVCNNSQFVDLNKKHSGSLQPRAKSIYANVNQYISYLLVLVVLVVVMSLSIGTCTSVTCAAKISPPTASHTAPTE